MARYECERCKATLNTTDFDENDPNSGHLCKDIKKRYERQARAVALIGGILSPYFESSEEMEEVAVQIVRKISGLNLEDT